MEPQMKFTYSDDNQNNHEVKFYIDEHGLQIISGWATLVLRPATLLDYMKNVDTNTALSNGFHRQYKNGKKIDVFTFKHQGFNAILTAEQFGCLSELVEGCRNLWSSR